MRVSNVMASSSPTVTVVAPRSAAYCVESPIGSSNEAFEAALADAGSIRQAIAIASAAAVRMIENSLSLTYED